MFLPDQESCYAFWTRYNFCNFPAFDDVIMLSDHQSYFKTTVYGASLLYFFVPFHNVAKNSQEVTQKNLCTLQIDASENQTQKWLKN